jgi:guanylate kinase
LDVDVKGGLNVQTQYRNSTFPIYRTSIAGRIEKRLEERGTETPESLEARISKASFELSFKPNLINLL